MVFQHFNLFPHLTVLQNCTLAPIWVRKTAKKQAEELAMHYRSAYASPNMLISFPASFPVASSNAWLSPAHSV